MHGSFHFTDKTEVTVTDDTFLHGKAGQDPEVSERYVIVLRDGDAEVTLFVPAVLLRDLLPRTISGQTYDCRK